MRIAENQVEHLVLADSLLLLVSSDDSLEALYDDREFHVGQRYRQVTDAEPNGTAAHNQARDAYVQALIEHRNQSGGFWVAAGDPTAAAEALAGSHRRDELRAAALLSDGASRLVNRFHLMPWDGVVSVLETSGPVDLIRAVRAAEKADPAGTKWPRGKATDDATVAWCTDLGPALSAYDE
jgi:hypothetical protein